MKKWVKRLIIIAAIAAAGVSAFFIYTGVKLKAEQEKAFSAESSTGQVTTGDITLTVSGSGNLSSADILTLMAEEHIAADEVLVEEGDSVEEGETLITLDKEAMADYLDEVEEQVQSIQTQIDTMNNVSTNLSIKSTADGWIKNVLLDEDDYVEDAMDEYGYVALVATEFRELINAEGSGLSTGDEVKVKSEGKWHDGVVVEENDTLYVSIDTVYRTVGADAVVYKTDNTEVFTGKIELASYQIIESSFGIITDVKFSEDEEIEAGEVIYKATQYSQEATKLYKQLKDGQEEYDLVSSLIEQGEIKSTCTGVVTSVGINDGQVCEEGDILFTIASTDSWQAVVSVDELDINTIEIGQRVEVTLDSMPYETFTGQVTGISEYGSASGGITTYDVKVAVDDNDGFKLAMTLNCEIETQSAQNAVLAPIDAIRTSGNKTYVIVAVERSDEEIAAIKQLITDSDYTALADYLGEDAQTLGINMLSDWSELIYGEVRAVEVGFENAFYAEIKSGLSEGETVLLTSSDSSSSEMFFMQGVGGMITNGEMGSGQGQRPDNFQPPSGGMGAR